MTVRWRLVRAMALLGALFLALPAWAVDLNATLKGVVRDGEDLPIPGVELVLSSPALQGDRTTTTDPEGRYRFTPLPPGDYVVRASKKGFERFESVVLKVPVATTVQYDIVLLPEGEAGMEIEVVEAAPAVDTERVNTGVVLDYDFLKDVPTGRDYQSAVQLTPGVVGGANPNVHGAFYSSNQYYIDGVNVTDPMTNTFSTNMNFDAIDSVQVLTGGLDAEYGRSLGGAINVVTKSGGNDFAGQVNLTYHQGPAMVLARPIEEYGDRFDSNLEEQVVLNLGGPIRKDKVWFFGSVQADRLVSTISFDTEQIPRDLDRYPMLPRDWRSLYWFGKITAQPTTAHRVWIQAQGDPTWIDNVAQDPYTLPSGEQFWYQGGWLGSVGHQWTPNQSVLLETQAYFQRSVLNTYSMLWKHCQEFRDVSIGFDCAHDFVGMEYAGEPVPPSFYGNGPDDFSAGEYTDSNFNIRNRASLTSSLTLFANELLGEHRFKTGFQGELLRSREVWPGQAVDGLPYYTYDESHDPEGLGPTNPFAYVPDTLYLWDNPWELSFTGYLVSGYVQDVWKPVPRLTLRPGLRLDYSAMRNEDDKTTKVVEKPEVVFDSITLAPRFGAAYELTDDGRTSAHLAYGRFYDSGFLVLSSLLQRTSQSVSGYAWDPEIRDWDFDNPIFTTSDLFLKHSDLRNPYSDEIDAGIAREIGPGTLLDVTFVYEQARRFWEDDEVNLIWNDDGTQVIGYRNGRNEAVYRLRTPDNTFTRYTSIETQILRSQGDNLNYLVSYVFSRAYGTNSADQATANLDIPEQRPYEIGLLAYDVRHNVKTSGSYTEPRVFRVGRTRGGYVVGWNYYLQSGTPYRPLAFNNYYNAYMNAIGPRTGRYRLPAQSQLDLRAGLTLDYDDRTNWMLGVDVFNVFNDREITSVSTAYDPDATVEESNFGAVLTRQSPRRLQISIRGQF